MRRQVREAGGHVHALRPLRSARPIPCVLFDQGAPDELTRDELLVLCRLIDRTIVTQPFQVALDELRRKLDRLAQS